MGGDYSFEVKTLEKKFQEIFDQRPITEKLLLPVIGQNQEFALKNFLLL